jgi:hypothetical protein
VVIGSAIVAALLANYWVLEDLLADRHNFDAAWISDLSTRSESSGGVFVALGIVAAIALLIYGGVLVATLGGRGPLLRWGAVAFFVAAGFTLIAAAAPLSCAEGLESACSLAYDPFDIIHATANLAEIAAAALAFGLVGLGLRRLPRERGAGDLTLAIGAVWLILTAATGLSYLSGDIDSVKGLLQRADQLVFGAWLVLLGLWFSRAPFRGRTRAGAGGPP